MARAAHHLDDFNREVQAFLDETEFSLTSDTDTTRGDRLYFAGAFPEPPLSLGLIVGDYLHNLRSTLDHVICELSLITDPSSSCEKTAFPVCSTDHGWLTALGKELKLVSPGAQYQIHLIQPLNWQDRAAEGHRLHPMWELNELWNWDKHRSLHLVHWASSRYTFLEIEGDDGVGVTQYLDDGPIDAGVLIARVPAEKATRVRVRLKPRVHFALDGPARGKDVGIALGGYYSTVESILNRLQPFLVADGSIGA
jgi:hypothetical protein